MHEVAGVVLELVGHARMIGQKVRILRIVLNKIRVAGQGRMIAELVIDHRMRVEKGIKCLDFVADRRGRRNRAGRWGKGRCIRPDNNIESGK